MIMQRRISRSYRKKPFNLDYAVEHADYNFLSGKISKSTYEKLRKLYDQKYNEKIKKRKNYLNINEADL